jgi:hypothetical protein
MNTNIFYKRYFILFVALLIITFVLYSTSTFLFNIQYENLLSFPSAWSSSGDTRRSLHPIIEQINLTVLPTNHTIRETRFIRSSYLQNWQRLAYTQPDIYKLTFIYVVLLFIYCFIALIRKTGKRLSVIALLLASHAPPNAGSIKRIISV